MSYEYNVVPFIGRIRGGKFDERSAAAVAEQLEAVITEHATDGWEFYRIDQVQIEVKPGCLGGLLGQKAAYVLFDEVVFRRETP